MSSVDGPSQPVTDMLVRWRAGDQHALDELIPLVYDELRRDVSCGGNGLTIASRVRRWSMRST